MKRPQENDELRWVSNAQLQQLSHYCGMHVMEESEQKLAGNTYGEQPVISRAP